jgi:hypothetical protein
VGRCWISLSLNSIVSLPAQRCVVYIPIAVTVAAFAYSTAQEAMSRFSSRPMRLLASAEYGEVSDDLYAHLEEVVLFEVVVAFEE